MTPEELAAAWKATPPDGCMYVDPDHRVVLDALVVAFSRVEELEAALDDGVSCIEQLAGQQAMADNWYLPIRDRMLRVLGGES